MAGVLLPYQMQWINDPTPVRVYEKSRRIGISWSTAAEAALVAAAASGMDVWYIGYNKDMAEEFIRDSADWIGHYQLVAEAVSEEILNDGDKDILTFVIRCASGYRITALSSRPSNLRGKQGYVIIDEAAFHEQLDELLKAAMALLMWGGKVAIISTHDGVDNPFNQLCQDIRCKRKPYALHRTTFDEAVAQGLYRRICQVRGIEWTAAGEAAWVAGIYDQYGADADEELRVIPSNSGGAVLSRSLLELRAAPVPILRLAQPDGWAEYPAELRSADIADWCERELRPLLATLDGTREHVFGMDFARHGDLSVLVPLQIAADTRRHVPFAVELRNIPHAQQRQIVYYLPPRGLTLPATASISPRLRTTATATALRKSSSPTPGTASICRRWWRRWKTTRCAFPKTPTSSTTCARWSASTASSNWDGAVARRVSATATPPSPSASPTPPAAAIPPCP